MIKCEIENYKPELKGHDGHVSVDMKGHHNQILNECAILTAAVINSMVPDAMPENMQDRLKNILLNEIEAGVLFYMDVKPAESVNVSELKKQLQKFGGGDNDNNKTN